MSEHDLIVVLVTSIAGFVVGRANTFASKKDKENEEKDRVLHELIESQKSFYQFQKEMTANHQKLVKQIDCLSERLEKMVQGGKCLLRDRIIQSCRVFIERGSIPLLARSNIQDLFRWYHDELDGNGTAEALYNEMMQLPIDDSVPFVSAFCINKNDRRRKNEA